MQNYLQHYMLAKDETLQEKLETNIAKYAVTNADEIIAKEILSILNSSKGEIR